MDEKTLQFIERLGINAENSSGAMQQLIISLSKVNTASNGTANAASVAAQSLQDVRARSDAVANSFRTFTGAIGSYINGLTNLTSSVYGADKAFTSVIPTLDLIVSTFSKAVTGAGQALSGISIAGFSIGKASEAAAQGIVSTAEVLSSVLKFQLESAQKVSDQFLSMSKVGATFGGRISEMGAAAAGLRVPLLEFGKFVVSNVENLTKMGFSVTQAAKLTMGLGGDIYDTSDALVALYGSVENISAGVAEYYALQTQLGQNMKTRQEQDYIGLQNSARDYLIRQKELTAITGKNAELLKKEEEGRRKQLDYNLKLGRLSEEARKNVQEGMAIAGKTFGDAGAKYAEEYFATNGKVVSAEGLAYAATNQEAAAAIEQLMSTVKSSREQYRKGYGQYFAANADVLEAAAKNSEDLAEIMRATSNPIIKGMADTGSAIIQSLTFFRNMPGILEEIERERSSIVSDKLDPATQAFVNAERQRNEVQQKIDATVLKNMTDLGSTVTFLNNMTLSMVSQQKAIGEILTNLKNMTFNGAEGFNEAIQKLIDSIYRSMGFPLSPPNTPTGPTTTPRMGETGGGAAIGYPGHLGPRQQNNPATPPPAPAAPATAPSQTVGAMTVESLVAELAKTNKESTANNTLSEQQKTLETEIARLKTQITNLTSTSETNSQLITILNGQTSLMETLNSSMSDLIRSNKDIFTALA